MGRFQLSYPDETYRWRLASAIAVIYAFNNIDRLALSLVLESIKHDLALNDTELGTLTGIAFALFYSAAGLPIARLADRADRVKILAFATGAWSAAVALCGVATNFMQLFVLRAGVGIGEASCAPTANSMIADYFPREERPRATARFMLGAPAAALLGFFFAGWLSDQLGWRRMFLILGAPGVVLGVVTWILFKDHLRSASAGSANLKPVPGRADRRTMWRLLTQNATFLRLAIAYPVFGLFVSGSAKWQPTFFIRSHGVGTTEIGLWFTLIYGVIGIVAILSGAELVTRFAAGNEGRQLRLIAGGYVCLGISTVFLYTATAKGTALVCLSLGAFGSMMTTAPMMVIIQSIVPSHIRAQSIAILFLMANLVGYGIGPLLAGSLSDLLTPAYGRESLRYALLSLTPGFLLAGWLVYSASGTVASDIEAAAQQSCAAGKPPAPIGNAQS